MELLLIYPRAKRMIGEKMRVKKQTAGAKCTRCFYVENYYYFKPIVPDFLPLPF